MRIVNVMLRCGGGSDRRLTSVSAPAAPARVLAAVALPLLLIAPGCEDQAGAGTDTDASDEGATTAPAAAPDALEPFDQSVDGTAVSFRMVPLRLDVATGEAGATAETRRLWMGEKEISWDLYDVFVFGLDEDDASGADAITRPSKPYVAMDRGFGHAGFPVISVSHHGASEFCRWLSAKTGRTYRLPTEAEWRAACTQSAIDRSNLDSVVWHRGNAKYQTHEIGSRNPDGVGLYDLWGNAAEWCTDADGNPVVMGGSYRDGPEKVGCTSRQTPSDAWNASDPQLPKSIWWLADAGFIGFRVVCEPDE
jgi:hypothetical protein